MLKFLICEDEEKQREIIMESIENIITNHGIDGQIVICSENPTDILNFIENNLSNEDKYVYLLDIDLSMKKINGLSLAKKIRDKDSQGYIIFITGHPELSLKTFEYNLIAFDYIVKENITKIKSKLEKSILLINDKYSKVSTSSCCNLTIKSGCRTFNINMDDIIFLETSVRHRIKLHKKNEQIEFYDSFKNLLCKLDPKLFYRCHNSYIVNVKHIKEINKREQYIVMSNGEKCMASRFLMKGLVKNVSDNL